MSELTVCADAELAARAACAQIARALEEARAARGVAHLALSGGRTPGRTYELLSPALESWRAVELWFADERCVPAEDEQSNYRLVAQTLLEGTRIAPGQVHRMEGELGPTEGARRYGQALRERLDASADAPPALDVVLLGVGPDGHVASLFPGHPALSATAQQLCVGISDSPKPPAQRITLSLPLLRSARAVILLASGPEKARAVAGALAQPTPKLPASLLCAERLTVIVDEDAAAALPDATRRARAGVHPTRRGDV
jgi:6-phosphogluconolactonase